MGTTLTIDASGERFCVNGQPTLLVGASYFAALAASRDFIEDDLRDLKRAGVNWIRVWATWGAFGQDVAALDADGDERPGPWEKLLWLIDFADKLTTVVDVTLSRGEGVAGPAVLADDEAHLNAVTVLAEQLGDFRNVYFDLAAERNTPDGRPVPTAFVRRLRDRVKEIDPHRLVTASHAGDIVPDRLYEYLIAAKVDFLAPHRPRGASSPAETHQKTRTLRSRMARLGKRVPLHYQEPFRRGLGGPWQPVAEDFLADLAGAASAGAAGWCLHNGPTAGAPDDRPRRCFDMRPSEGRLVEQLEDTERAVLRKLKDTLAGSAAG